MKIRVKRILAMLMLTLFLVTALAVTTGVAFADPPKFKGNDQQHCKDPSSGKTNPNCPGPVRTVH